MKQLHIIFTGNVRVYWCVPNHSVGEGLRPLKCDAHIVEMNEVSKSAKNIHLYVDHHNLLELQNNKVVDDPLFDGQNEMPDVTLDKRKKRHVYGQNGQGEGSDEDTDTETIYVDSEYEIDDDDDLYVHNIDDIVEDEMCVKKGKGPMIEPGDEEEDNDTPDVEELQLPVHEGNESINFNFHTFRADIDMNNPIFRVGMIFADIIELRKAVDAYSLKNRRPIQKVRNEKNRLEAVCKQGCPWFLKAGYDNRSQSILVKHYDGNHTCNRVWELKAFTAPFLAKRYLEHFRDDEKLSLKAFSKIVQREFQLKISRSKMSRARRAALKEIYGEVLEQYNLLWDYGQELRTTNPGSTFWLTLKTLRHAGPPPRSLQHFSTCYYSLDACKRGFLEGCRPIICVDGCHIKTKYGGQLFTAVGIDGNDSIYPIAWVVTEVESTNS